MTAAVIQLQDLYFAKAKRLRADRRAARAARDNERADELEIEAWAAESRALSIRRATHQGVAPALAP